MPPAGQLDDISTMAAVTHDQLRHALELIPEDQMGFKAAALATTPTRIAIHSCSADLSYSNTIDGGSRRAPLSPEDQPSKEALLQLIADTRQSVAELCSGLDEEGLEGERTVRWRQEPVTVRWILMHMIRHAHYHTGQLNYIHFLLGIDQR